MPTYSTSDSYAVETVDNIDRARKRLIGKLVRSTSEGDVAIGIVEAVMTQRDMFLQDQRSRVVGSATDLVIMIRKPDDSLKSNWLRWGQLEVHGA